MAGDPELFYFLNIESRDAELLRLKHQTYGNDYNRQIGTYEKRMKHQNADQRVIKEDIKRLRILQGLEEDIARSKVMIDGEPATLIALVEQFENLRKKGGITIKLKKDREGLQT